MKMSTETADFGHYRRSQSETLEVSPKLTLTIRIIGLVTAAMAVLAFILCMTRGSHNNNVYLQATNILLTSMVTTVFALYYRTGRLGQSYFWVLLLVFALLLLQALLSSVLAYNYPKPHKTE